MAYEQKPDTGSLFKNERKEKDTHADYKGSALIDGVEHWLDAWINKDRNGNSYMSLKFKRKTATEPQARQRWDTNEVTPIDDEEDAPF